MNAAIEEARARHASLCPACFAVVPLPQERHVPLHGTEGQLLGEIWRIEVSETGLRTYLEIATPHKVLYRGTEPGQRWTPRGAAVLAAAPLVVLAILAGLGLLLPEQSPLAIVSTLLAVAVAVATLMALWWQPDLPLAERVHRYAWTLLAPQLHKTRFVEADAAFLDGLVEQSNTDLAELHRECLPRLLDCTEQAVRQGLATPSQLAALWRLEAEDAVVLGDDPVPLVVEHLSRCFTGALPLSCAERLLEEWETDWWTPGSLARLRVLLCEAAFEAGFEVRNLLDAGQACPALAAVLNVDDSEALAALRLLWSQRASRPWDRCGRARSVFDLAADSDHEDLLGERPDLLLMQQDPAWPNLAEKGRVPTQARLDICAAGLRLQGELFTQPPEEIEVYDWAIEHELHLDSIIFESEDPLKELSASLKRWFAWFFTDFQPALIEVPLWRTPNRAVSLRAWGAIPCAECGRHFLPRLGAVGAALETDRPAS
jgi:hypothetical protein